MLSFDIDQAQYHLRLLRGVPDTEVHWQFYDDSKGSRKAYDFYSTLNNALDSIVHYQKQGLGLYVTINPTDGLGRKIQNITSYDWAFADLDGVEIPNNFPIEPSFITGRDSSHTHIYWSLTECVTGKQYSALQKRIALYLKSDEQVTDPSRVLRVAGSLHLKDQENPKQYSVMVDNQHDFEYTLDELVEAFVLNDEDQETLDKWVGSRESLNSGTGFDDNPIYMEQAKHYYSVVANPCMGEGTGASENLIRVAHYGRDRGLSEEVNFILLWDNFNPRCVPPWEDDEKKHFRQSVKNAYRYGLNAPGSCTSAGFFENNVEPAPEPYDGWEQHYKDAEKIAQGKKEEAVPFVEPETDLSLGFVTEKFAAMESVLLNSKSKEHDLAVVFLGTIYPNRKLIRNCGVFYTFTGKCWKEVFEENILYQIEHLYQSLKLAPSKIQNVLKKVITFTYFDKELKKGTWLRNDQGENCLTVNNGLLIIKGKTKKLIPHTQDFFDLNSLSFDYVPGLVNQEWIALLMNQWDIDTVTQEQQLRMVQELYGVMLLPDNRFQIIPTLIGKSRSGKGVHSKVIEAIFGRENICSPSLEGLASDSKILEMATTKLAIIPEANNIPARNREIILDRIKMLSGNDTLTIERKYMRALTWSSWAMIILVANELPEFTDSSSAFANRIRPLKFIKSYAGREDLGLAERLTTPEALSGIFNWLLEGLDRVLETGEIYRSDLSKEVVDDVRYDTFPLSKFINDFCHIDDGGETLVDDLYRAYITHSHANGVKLALSQRKFSRLLSASPLPITKVRCRTEGTSRVYKYTGITVDFSAMEKIIPIGGGVIVDAAAQFKNIEAKNETK